MDGTARPPAAVRAHSQGRSANPSRPQLGRAGRWDNGKLRIALSIAQALVYVHSFNPPIVHRDVKARNVMLDGQLIAKLTDFGIAREQSEDGTMITGIGTNRWLAPEVIRGGGAYNEQCDIYSFGVLLTELDAHRVSYANVIGASEIVLLHRVSRGELRPTVSNECDTRIRAVIDACLTQDPSERVNAMEVAYTCGRSPDTCQRWTKGFAPFALEDTREDLGHDVKAHGYAVASEVSELHSRRLVTAMNANERPLDQ